jgi:hypothetical protein
VGRLLVLDLLVVLGLQCLDLLEDLVILDLLAVLGLQCLDLLEDLVDLDFLAILVGLEIQPLEHPVVLVDLEIQPLERPVVPVDLEIQTLEDQLYLEVLEFLEAQLVQLGLVMQILLQEKVLQETTSYCQLLIFPVFYQLLLSHHLIAEEFVLKLTSMLAY